MTESPVKKARIGELTHSTIDSMPTIGTHDGSFHADEALAVFLLKQLEQFSNAKVIRSRESSLLATCTVVVDVGGIYDAATLRYDHHQRGFDQVFGPSSLIDTPHYFDIKLSSAGLVYKHHGQDVIRQMLLRVDPGASLSADLIEKLWLKLYKSVIAEYDAVDNGIDMFKMVASNRCTEGDDKCYMKRIYHCSSSISSRVGNLNPGWNAPEDEQSDAARLASFLKAVQLTGDHFADALLYLWQSWLPARSIVEDSVRSSVNDFPEAKGLVVRLTGFCPWKEHLFEVEADLALEPKPQYVLYGEGGKSEKWRIQAVPLDHASFQNRLPLPEPWRGLRDDQLSAAAGVEGCVFVHAAGFIGGTLNEASARALAVKALRFHGKL